MNQRGGRLILRTAATFREVVTQSGVMQLHTHRKAMTNTSDVACLLPLTAPSARLWQLCCSPARALPHRCKASECTHIHPRASSAPSQTLSSSICLGPSSLPLSISASLRRSLYDSVSVSLFLFFFFFLSWFFFLSLSLSI